MADPGGSDPLGAGGAARATAKRIADEISPLVWQARAHGFDFLAYLLGMALKESRSLAEKTGFGPGGQ